LVRAFTIEKALTHDLSKISQAAVSPSQHPAVGQSKTLERLKGTSMRGKILFLSPKAPWGFIAQEFHEDGRPATGDIFYHLNQFVEEVKPGSIQPGTLVEYAEGRSNGKPCAVNIRILPKPAPADGVRDGK
jgi:hypothetical protein